LGGGLLFTELEDVEEEQEAGIGLDGFAFEHFELDSYCRIHLNFFKRRTERQFSTEIGEGYVQLCRSSSWECVECPERQDSKRAGFQSIVIHRD
jgi:hypothetical protein